MPAERRATDTRPRPSTRARADRRPLHDPAPLAVADPTRSRPTPPPRCVRCRTASSARNQPRVSRWKSSEARLARSWSSRAARRAASVAPRPARRRARAPPRGPACRPRTAPRPRRRSVRSAASHSPRKAVAAGRPAHGLDGHARGRERLDVTVHGPYGDVEQTGDLRRRQRPRVWSNSSSDTSRVARIRKHDRRCPLCLEGSHP